MRPSFKITANDSNITNLIKDRFIELRITDEVNEKSDLLEIRLDDNGHKIDVPHNDVEIAVELGYDGKLEKVGVFSGLEIEFSGPPSVVVIRASAMNLRKNMKAKKTRSFENKTLSDIVSSIANEHGYTAIVDEFLATIFFIHVAQTNETDWQLINRLARDYDAFVKAAGGKLVVAMRGQKISVATRAQLPTVTLEPKDVERWSIKYSDKTKTKSVKARWHDKASAQMQVIESGSGEPQLVLEKIYDSEADAKQAADAKLNKMQRLERVARIKLAGRTDLVAMGQLVLKKFRTGVDGDYKLTRVDHVLSADRGYRCEIEAEL